MTFIFILILQQNLNYRSIASVVIVLLELDWIYKKCFKKHRNSKERVIHVI